MSITRVDYRERQRLTAADLRAEQEYRLGLAGRHHLTHHQWGVVRGLHVIVQLRSSVILTPGVAIDGYGREIVVGSPVELSVRDGSSLTPSQISSLLSGDRCWDVVLHYCESPEQVPPGRKCRDDPAPRIGQHFTWAVEEAGTVPSPPSDGGDLARARAAGRLPGLPPWPVLVARVGRGCWPDDDPNFVPPLVDYSLTRYVRHRAALVRSPTGRAALQLGLTGRTDVYHFAVSTRDDGKGLVRRVAIDRDGTAQIWRPLVVSGAEAVGTVPVAYNKVVRIRMPMPAGIGRRVRIEAMLDPAELKLTAVLRDAGELRATERPPLIATGKIQATRPLRVALRFGAARATTFELLDADGAPSLFVKRAKKGKAAVGAPPPEPVAEKVSAQLGPAGGILSMRMQGLPAAARAAVACGDVERARVSAAEVDTPIVQFKPAGGIKGDPLAREIHAVTTSLASDPVPQTELRLSGGAEDESDASSRLSIGRRDPEGPTPWLPAVRMDGGRRLAILAGSAGPVSDALLKVEDTVYLPPIGKDDPLLPDLLAMAFISGLRQIGASLPGTTATLEYVNPARPAHQPPPYATIVRGDPLEYAVNVVYSDTIQVKRCLEIITGTLGTGDMAFRTLLTINSLPSGQSPKRIVVLPSTFMHPASRVRIEVQMLLKKGNATGVVVSDSLVFDVVDQP